MAKKPPVAPKHKPFNPANLKPYVLPPADLLRLHDVYNKYALRVGIIDAIPAGATPTESFSILAAAPPETSFAIKAVDPMIAMIAPYAGTWGYRLDGFGLVMSGQSAASPIGISGNIIIDVSGTVVTSDTAHANDNRPGQVHPAWLPFKDFMVSQDPDTGAMYGNLLAHWHAGTGQPASSVPSPVGPFADVLIGGDINTLILDFTAPSGMYLRGTMVRQLT